MYLGPCVRISTWLPPPSPLRHDNKLRYLGLCPCHLRYYPCYLPVRYPTHRYLGQYPDCLNLDTVCVSSPSPTPNSDNVWIVRTRTLSLLPPPSPSPHLQHGQCLSMDFLSVLGAGCRRSTRRVADVPRESLDGFVLHFQNGFDDFLRSHQSLQTSFNIV